MKNNPMDYLSSSVDAVGKFLRRSNAMGPILIVILLLTILCGVVLPCSIKIDAFVYLAFGVAGILGITVIAFVGIFIYFAVKNPRALQSEDLQITMRQMDLAVASKGEIPSVTFNDSDNIEILKEIKGSEEISTAPERYIENAIKEGA